MLNNDVVRFSLIIITLVGDLPVEKPFCILPNLKKIVYYVMLISVHNNRPKDNYV